MYNGGRNFQADLVRDDRNFFRGLHTQADVNRVARSRRELRIKGHAVQLSIGLFRSCIQFIQLQQTISERKRAAAEFVSSSTPTRLFNDVVHHSLHVARFPENAQLTVRARAHLHDLADIFDFSRANEFVEHVIDKSQIFFDQFALRNFLLTCRNRSAFR